MPLPEHRGEARPYKYNRHTKNDFFSKLLPCRSPDHAIGVTGQHMDFSQLHAIDFVVGGSVNSSNAIALPLDAIFQENSTVSTGVKRARCVNTRMANKKRKIDHLANQLYIMEGMPKSYHDICVDDPPQGDSGAQSSNQSMVPSASMTTTNPVVTSTTPKRDGDENTILEEAPVAKKVKQLAEQQHLPELSPMQLENRQYVPKLSASLLAKFSRFGPHGGSMKRDTGAVEQFSTYPLANHDGPRVKRVATIATDLCASARAKVYLDSDGAIIGRPPEDFPS